MNHFIRCGGVKKEALVCCNSEFHAFWQSSDRLLFTMKRYLWPYIQFAYANYANTVITVKLAD